MPEQMLLQASHLTVSYQGTTIVRDVSFCLAAGQVLGIAGESGCGKTTLLRALMGLSRPGGHIEGHVFLAETDLLSLTGEQLRNLRGKEIAMIPQNALSSLDQTMTISALFRQSLRVHGTVCSKQESDARAMQWLQRLHFVHSERILQSYPFELSGGMGQRVVMALALLHGPKLLLADEPTSALDVISQNKVVEELEKMRQEQGLTLVMISHHLGILSHSCTMIAVMYAGQIVEWGRKEQVLGSPAHPYTRALVAAVPDMRGVLPAGLKGTPPPFDGLGDGCAFAPRCLYAKAGCRQSQPALYALGGGHWAACALYGGGKVHDSFISPSDSKDVSKPWRPFGGR